MSSTTSLKGEGNAADNERDPRLCEHVNADGSPCRGWKAKGTSLCGGHLGLGVAADPREAASRSAEVRSESAEVRSEARKRSLKDLLADRLEAKADVIADRLESVIANGSDADALRAIESWLSRVHGKPKETVVTEEAEPAIVSELRALTPEQRRALLRDWNEPDQEAATGS